MVEKKKESIIDEYKYAVLVGAGSFVLALVLIFAIGQPLWNGYKSTSKQLKEKRDVLAKLEEKLENLKKLKDKEAEIKEKNQKVTAALPTDKDISRLFVQFENVANQNGLTIDSVQEAGSAAGTSQTTTQPSEAGGVKAVSYTVTGTARDYASMKQALTKLEESLRILNVSKVDTTNQSGKVGVTLTVSTYTRGSN